MRHGCGDGEQWVGGRSHLGTPVVALQRLWWARHHQSLSIAQHRGVSSRHEATPQHASCGLWDVLNNGWTWGLCWKMAGNGIVGLTWATIWYPRAITGAHGDLATVSCDSWGDAVLSRTSLVLTLCDHETPRAAVTWVSLLTMTSLVSCPSAPGPTSRVVTWLETMIGIQKVSASDEVVQGQNHEVHNQLVAWIWGGWGFLHVA